MDSSKKASFTSRFGLIASSAAAAVGLGNIWRFPAEVAANGGGIYLLIYLFFTILIGFPMVASELALGRKSGKGSFAAYEGRWQWMGFVSPLIAWSVLGFYHVLSAWVLSYAYKTIRGDLFTHPHYEAVFENMKSTASANLIFLAIIILCVVMITQKNISHGIEKLSKVAMPLLLVMILGLVLYALTLPHAFQGVSFYLFPRWDKFSFSAVISALNQSFMSLGIGAGVSIAYGSYARKKENFMYSSALIVMSDLLIAFLAGFFLFPFLFYQDPTVNPQSQGVALTFIHLPAIFASMGKYQGLWVGFIFFSLLWLAAMTSSVALLEVPTQFLCHRYDMKRKKVVLLLAGSSFLLSSAIILSHAGIPLFHLRLWGKDLMDWVIFFAVDIAQPLMASLFCIYIARYWGISALIAELEKGGELPAWQKKLLYITIGYLAPMTIGSTLLLSLLRFLE